MSDELRDLAIEAMADAMRPTLGGDWVKFSGGGGIAGLALDALLPIIAKAARDQEVAVYGRGDYVPVGDWLADAFSRKDPHA